MLKSCFAAILLGTLLTPIIVESVLDENDLATIRALIATETRKMIDEIDYEKEFDKVKDDVLNFDTLWDAAEIGMSPGVFIFLIILLLMIPNLIVIGVIFLICWGCKCGCFYYKREDYAHADHKTAIIHHNNTAFIPSQTQSQAPLPGHPVQMTEKPSLMPVRSRFTKPASRIHSSSGAPMSPTGSASQYQDDNQW